MDTNFCLNLDVAGLEAIFFLVRNLASLQTSRFALAMVTSLPMTKLNFFYIPQDYFCFLHMPPFSFLASYPQYQKQQSSSFDLLMLKHPLTLLRVLPSLGSVLIIVEISAGGKKNSVNKNTLLKSGCLDDTLIVC